MKMLRSLAAVTTLVMLAILLRRPMDPGKLERRPPPSRSEAPPVSRKPLEAGSRSDDPFRSTAERLEVVRSEEFIAVSRDAAAMLHRAQVRRQRDLSAPDPGLQAAIDADAAYESAREEAMARLEPFLDQRTSHREFRQQIDTWAATVWAASQGVYAKRRS